MPLALTRADETRVVATGTVPLGALSPGDYVVRGIIRLEDGTSGRVVRTLRKVVKYVTSNCACGRLIHTKGSCNVAPVQISIEIEESRDQRWQREATRQIETPFDAERFVDRVGFAACLTDARRPGPSLYVAVCGRRDAIMPRNVQKDPEASHTWHLKDELVRRGKVYYGKLTGARTLFIAPRMIPYFHAVWGMRRAEESRRLSRPARAILHVLRREWEMATSDLRTTPG